MLNNILRRVPVQTRVKEYRSHFSMTQDDLAKKVGVRRETIVFLEQGKYNPSLRLAHDIARALHAGIDDLFIFDDDENEQGSPEQRVILVD
jgi:putative transcriptional regulator